MTLASSTIPAIHCDIKFPSLQYIVINAVTTVPSRRRKPATLSSYQCNSRHSLFFFKPKLRSVRTVLARVTNGDGAADASPQQSSAVVSFFCVMRHTENWDFYEGFFFPWKEF